MSDRLSEMTLRPIGFVRNDVKEKPPIGFKWDDMVSEIVVEQGLTEALDGLEDFSHIVVLFWFDRAVVNGDLPPKTHLKGDPTKPLVGRFATRSPHRRNPIGMSTVRLLERKGNILKVVGLDALDGSPVLDIKPHIPRSDAPSGSMVPPWIGSQ